MEQYFMYGILVSYDTYLKIIVNRTVEDILEGEEDIRGIFTGRNGDFMIIGKVLPVLNTYLPESNNIYRDRFMETVEEHKEVYVVPEIDVIKQGEIEGSVCSLFGIEGEFHYYFIKK